MTSSNLSEHKPRIIAALQPTRTQWGNSRWSELARCPRAHRLQYVDGIVPTARPSYFGIGSLIHSCLMYRNVGRIDGLDLCPLDVIDYAEQYGDAEGNPVDESITTESRRILEPTWEAADLPGKVLAAEYEMSVELAPGIVYTARADAIIEVSGEVMVADYKTRSRARSWSLDTSRELATRPQFLGLSHLTELAYNNAAWHNYNGGLDDPPAVLVVDIIKTATPKTDRQTVRIKRNDVDQWLREQPRLIQSQLGQDYMNFSQCAPEISFRCSYFTMCHGTDEERTRDYEKVEAAT